MTISLKHKFVSPKEDGEDEDLVKPSDWNDEHDLTLASDRLLGRDTAGTGDVEEITVGGGLEFTGSGGIQRSELTGDVTASAGSNSTTIANKAVTYAKIQDVSATDKLLGRATAGAGTIEEIPCTAAGRALLDDADAATQRATLGLGNTATMNEATISEYRSAAADRPISPDTAWGSADLVTLTQATTIAVDFSQGFNFTTTMTGNRTLGAPSNVKVGQSGVIRIVQDATGTRTLAYASVWKFPGGTVPTIKTGSGAVSVLSYIALASNFIFAVLTEDVK